MTPPTGSPVSSTDADRTATDLKPPRRRGRRATVLGLLGAVAAVAAMLVSGSGSAGAQPGLPGIDVSHYQGTINWSSVAAGGVRFAYMKTTDGTTYTDPTFAANYNGSYNAGIIRGAYHFARPNASSGAAQANFFLAHGGRWSADGKTLPGLLDLENVAGQNECYNLSAAQMSAWIADFSNTYHAATTRYPVIYSRANWWNDCTGSNPNFAANNPLMLARYSSTPGTLPAGWTAYTIWQYADAGSQPGDQDVFNGSHDQLVKLATG